MDSISLPTLKPDLIALNAAVAPAMAVTGSINPLSFALNLAQKYLAKGKKN
tara:strand:- start:1135 stop:1287 length:153 start_codon:yes stop_codon:yes gene_type:complete